MKPKKSETLSENFPKAASWPDLLQRYGRALRQAEEYNDPALLLVEAELRRRLWWTAEREQVPIAAAVRKLEISLLGWATPTDKADESAPELRSLGFCERAITESRRLP